MIYIGLDVHKVNTTVAWLDNETGEISAAYQCRTDQLAEQLRVLPGPQRIVMEAGSSSNFVARQLKSCGQEVMVVDAYKAHRLLEAVHTAKTDKLDAAALAYLLAAGYLDRAAVWVADEQTHRLRELTRSHQALTQTTTRLRNYIRKFLVRQGRERPASDLLGQRGRQCLDELQKSLPAPLGSILASLRAALTAVAAQVQELLDSITTAAAAHPPAVLLQSIPGVGPVLALTIVAEIGAPARFPSAAHLRSYSGLVPRVSQSGERRWTGPLTKRGNRHLRWAMVLAAQHFTRSRTTKQLAVMKCYYHHLHKHGPNPAKVAVARRLLNIILAMLRANTEFDRTRLARAGP